MILPRKDTLRGSSAQKRFDQRVSPALERDVLREVEGADEERVAGEFNDPRFALIAHARDAEVALLEKRLEAAV